MEPAPLLGRLFAAIIDSVLILIVSIIFSVVFGVIDAVIGTEGLLTTLGSCLTLIVYFAYFTVLEGAGPQASIGKRLLGMKVIDFATGGAPGYGKAFIRILVYTILSLLAIIFIFFNPQRRGLHDMVAGCQIVRA